MFDAEAAFLRSRSPRERIGGWCGWDGAGGVTAAFYAAEKFTLPPGFLYR